MKSTSPGLWILGAALAWSAWIALDMSKPVSMARSASDTDLAALHSSKVPVLVQFHAEWCGPCRSVTPVVDALALELAGSGKARVLRVDVDKNPQAAAEHRVRGIPAFVVFKGGREVARRTGAIPRQEMLRMLGL